MADNVKISVPVHPGEIITEYLQAKSWTRADLARRLGLSRTLVYAICGGRAPVTAEIALALEPVLARPAQFWTNLQALYDETAARDGKTAKTVGARVPGHMRERLDKLKRSRGMKSIAEALIYAAAKGLDTLNV